MPDSLLLAGFQRTVKSMHPTMSMKPLCADTDTGAREQCTERHFVTKESRKATELWIVGVLCSV
jgi:hypothetical protein